MNPISICRFNGLTGVEPYVHLLDDLEQLVEFFTIKGPPTVKKEERSEFFSMAMFRDGTTRAKQNVESLSGLVLDFDNTEAGWIPLPEFILQLEQLGLVYLYYTTWSHTEVHHRWRLVLPFETPVAVDFWPEAHSRVLTLLGNPVGIDTAASRDVARMWIMPCKAAGGAYQIGYQTTGKFLNPHTLPPTLKQTSPVYLPSEFPKTTPDSVREALGYIDANSTYPIWLSIGMALHDEFGEAGFYIWNVWSAKGSKYKGEADLCRRWKTFGLKDGVKIATLFHYARERGYSPTPPSNSVSYVLTTGSISSDSKTATNLTVAMAPLSADSEITIEDENIIEEADEFIDPLEQCLADLLPYAVRDIFAFPCAILKSTFDWIQAVAPLPQPIFSLSACLSLMAFLKRDAVVSATALRTNLYILAIGPSRSGKNNALSCIHHLLNALGLKDFEISAFGSAQGLMKQLSEKEGKAYWVQDEITHIFKNFQNKNAGTHETRLEQKILTLYNCAYQTTDKIKSEKIAAVDNPYLNIFGTTTENIIDVLSPDTVVSGLLARFLVFWLKPDQGYPDYQTDLDTTVPQELTDALRMINEQRASQTAHLDDDAKQWFKTFCKATQRTQLELCRRAAKVDSLVGNLPEQTIKLALLVATSQRISVTAANYTAEYTSQIAIRLQDIQWAASVALHCFTNNLTMASMLTENRNEKYLNKIVKHLENHHGKWVRRYDLCMSLRYALNARQLDDLLEPLLESQKIIKTASKKGGGTLYRLNSTRNQLTANKRKIT